MVASGTNRYRPLRIFRLFRLLRLLDKEGEEKRAGGGDGGMTQDGERN